MTKEQTIAKILENFPGVTQEYCQVLEENDKGFYFIVKKTQHVLMGETTVFMLPTNVPLSRIDAKISTLTAELYESKHYQVLYKFVDEKDKREFQVTITWKLDGNFEFFFYFYIEEVEKIKEHVRRKKEFCQELTELCHKHKVALCASEDHSLDYDKRASKNNFLIFRKNRIIPFGMKGYH